VNPEIVVYDQLVAKGLFTGGDLCSFLSFWGVPWRQKAKAALADVFVGLRDPRQAKKVEHDLVELLVIAVCGVLAGADDFR
jgi:hypothetical protein